MAGVTPNFFRTVKSSFVATLSGLGSLPFKRSGLGLGLELGLDRGDVGVRIRDRVPGTYGLRTTADTNFNPALDPESPTLM